MASFLTDEVSEFRFRGYEADASRGLALLRYSLDDRYQFEERIDFGRGVSGPEGEVAGFTRVVRLLHLAAGVSYYKTAAPSQIVVEEDVSDCEIELCRAIYDLGLREFAYRNSLPIPRDIEIVRRKGLGAMVAEVKPSAAVAAPQPGIAVPIGGGKDSVVVLEALREYEPVVISVNPSEAAKRIASVAGSQLVSVTRTLDPQLFALNANGAMNGHVPVTAIVSLITIAAGYLFGYDTTAMALEGSADAPSRVVVNEVSDTSGHKELRREEVNHQWSKSLQFERLLQEVLRRSVHDSIRFVSPLRPFSELEVTAAFATLPQYLDVFRSCNRTARLHDAEDSWCGNCPKCRFVFLALASALDRASVVSLFGSDLLDDPQQIVGFCDMLDPERKPFECVGTVEEVEDAFGVLFDDPSWQGAVVVEKIRPTLSAAFRSRARSERATPQEVFETIRRIVAGA